MEEEFFTDITIEALEVLINYILYIREAYPKEIFQKKRVYNLPIFVSIYPPLNEYLLNMLNKARALKAGKQLTKVEVLFHKEKDLTCVYENYACDIVNKTYVDIADKDKYLLNLEEQLRTGIYALTERTNLLGKLPEDVGMKLRLHTNQSAYIKMCKDSTEVIPWLQVSNADKFTHHTTLPIMELPDCGINISIEVP